MKVTVKAALNNDLNKQTDGLGCERLEKHDKLLESLCCILGHSVRFSQSPLLAFSMSTKSG